MISFYDKKNKKTVYNTVFVDWINWDITWSDKWKFNKRTGVGTNPIVFRLD